MKAIEISHMTCDYGHGKGIFDISFTIDEGEVFGFLGPNGAGKTTTIRHLRGFIFAKEGNCSILGMDCGKQAATIQKELGYIPGEINLWEEMSGMQFLKFMAKFRGMKDMGRCEELMERFELDPSGRIKKMSKGMKQKVGIVAAFMHDPQILILDEPSSGLDPLMQNVFVDLIQEEKMKGKSILMSSHMFEEVERTCDRIGIIKDGHIVCVEDAQTLRQSKKRRYQIRFANINEVVRFQQEGFYITAMHKHMVEVEIHKNLAKLIQTLSHYEVEDIDVTHQSLEEIFMQYYGGEHHGE